MSTYLSQLLDKVKKSISDHIFIEDIDDYAVFDASFIFDNFQNLRYDKDFLQLGIYRVGKHHSGFFCAPYTHMKEVRGDYEPTLEEIPYKKSFLQKIGLAKSPKPEYKITHPYKASLSIDGIIPEPLTKEITPAIQHVLINNWFGDGIWDLFILSNLKYILPAFGHGIYKQRDFITSSEDLLNLPPEIRNQAFNLTSDLMPTVKYENNTAIITIHYFNKWKGLVRWKLRYATYDDSKLSVYANRVIFPADEETVLIPYDCGTRF